MQTGIEATKELQTYSNFYNPKYDAIAITRTTRDRHIAGHISEAQSAVSYQKPILEVGEIEGSRAITRAPCRSYSGK